MEPIVSTPEHVEYNDPRPDGGVPRSVLEQQSHILDQELAALLAEEQHEQLLPEDGPPIAEGGIDEDFARTSALPDATLLPGFDTLTTTDLQTCPAWCIHADLPVHSDGFDPDPEQAPHRGVEHTLHTIHGGASIDHAGRAEITVQLEQHRDLATGPVITLAVTVQGIEHYTWLTPPEAHTLERTLDQLLTDTDEQGRLG